MKDFNTFREQRYERSTFTPGAYLLASEAGDIELEILDHYREYVRKTYGDFFVADGWKVDFVNSTTFKIKPGIGYYQGLVYNYRYGQDKLVLGGVVDAAITATLTQEDDGFKVELAGSASTFYVIITAEEQLVDATDDEYLRNVNLTEDTSKKVRLIYKINLIPTSLIKDVYTSTENYLPESANNLVDSITINYTVGQDGEPISQVTDTGNVKIDGTDRIVTFRNGDSFSPLPSGATEQSRYVDGRLIDSIGNVFHITNFTTGSLPNTVVISIDKETDGDNKLAIPEQDNPVFSGSYQLLKKEVFFRSNTNVNPEGRLYKQIAEVIWDGASLVAEDITDLRRTLTDHIDFQVLSTQYRNAYLTEGGTWALSSGNLLSWNSPAYILVPGLSKQANTIPAGSISMNTSDLVLYVKLNRLNDTPTNLTLLTSQLADVDIASDDIFVIAKRLPSGVVVSEGTLLLPSESRPLGAGISDQNLTFVGIPSRSSSQPAYSSNFRGVTGESLLTRIGKLDNSDADFQEDRSGYLRSSDTVRWTGTQLEFTQDIVLEIINTKSGTTNTYTIQAAQSPITISNGESVYISVPRGTSGVVTPIKTGVTPIPAISPTNKDIFVLFKRIGTGTDSDLYLPFTKQLIEYARVVMLGASGSGSGGEILVQFYDPISTTLPTGTSVTIDGQAGANGDLVLYSNLGTGNNKVYQLSGVGTSIVWTPLPLFRNGSETPLAGEAVRFAKGDSYNLSLAIFDGTEFKVNERVRYFNGTDYWEQSAINATTVPTGTSTAVTYSAAGSENSILDYSIESTLGKQTGTIVITHDNTNLSFNRYFTDTASVGVDIDVVLNAGDVEINTTNTSGSSALLKFTLKRWSDNPGGPAGVPSYSGVSSTPVTAAGNTNDIQFKDAGGGLAADSRFKFVPSEDGMNLNGLIYEVLDTFAIANNVTSPAPIFTYPHASYKHFVVEYSISRDGNFRTGRLQIVTNGTLTQISDDFVETAATGITFGADISGSNVRLTYTSTNTGVSGTFKYTVRRWL